MAKQTILFIITIFSVVFILQWNIWQGTQFADWDKWQARTKTLASDLHNGRQLNQAYYTGHPAMAVLLPATLFYNFGSYPIPDALRLSVTFINTLTITGTILLCRSMWPGISRWFTVGGLIAVHPLYVATAPTTAVIAPLVVCIYFLGLFIYQQNRPSRPLMTVLAIAIGTGLATRWFISIALFAPLIFFLYVPSKRLREAVIVSGMAITVAIFLNPLLWYTPLVHLAYAFQRAALHVTVLDVDTVSRVDFVLFAPIGLLSFAFAAYYLFFPMQYRQLSIVYLRFSWYITAAIATILLLAHSKSLRYFFPLIFLWNAYLPIMVLDWIDSWGTVKSSVSRETRRVQYLATASTVILLLGMQLYLLLRTLEITAQFLADGFWWHIA